MENITILNLIVFTITYIIGFAFGRMTVRHHKAKLMTFATLARKIAAREGKKKSVNIAQINEILKIVIDELGLKSIIV